MEEELSWSLETTKVFSGLKNFRQCRNLATLTLKVTPDNFM